MANNKEQLENEHPLADTNGRMTVDLADITDADYPYLSVDYKDGDLAILTDILQIPEFTSLKMGINVLLFCLQGKLQFEVNGRQIVVHERELAIVQSNVTIGNFMISPDFRCCIACMSDRLVKGQLRGYISIWNRALYVNNNNIFKISKNVFLSA